MDQVIEKAQKRLADIEAEAAQLRAFIHMYNELAGEQRGVTTPRIVSAVAMAVPARAFAGGGPTVTIVKATPSEIVEASKALMQEKQRPLTRSELVRFLTLRGLKIAGTDKSKNIGTIIWRSKQFENVEGKGYWPLEFGPWGESEFNF